MVSQIEPKLGGRHGDSQLLKKHNGMIATVAATAAILKISYCELTCGFAPDQLMLWSVNHGPSLIRMSVSNIFDISIRIVSMMATMAAILKVFSCYLLLNSKSDGAET